MSPIIYISRRCQNSHEIIMLIHSNVELKGKFVVVDIDTNPYPSVLKVVPSMVIEDNIIYGEDLFKYIHIVLDKIKQRITPPLENSTKPIPSDTLQPNKQEKDDTKKQDEEDLPGFCIDGSCALDFSSLEEDIYINTKDKFEHIDESENKSTINLENLPEDNKDSSNQFANDYEKLIQERNNLLEK